MSIINLEKTFENRQLVYCNLDNKIIECICLSELSKYYVKDYYNEDLGTFVCDKVKVIAIYDIYKNIIYKPIQTDLFKDLIEIGKILENTRRKTNYFFKTFMGAFIKNNKLNNIKYYTNYKGSIYRFLYDNIELIINGPIKTFNIYDNEGKYIHSLIYTKNVIIYKNHNDFFEYTIYKNYIEITNIKFTFSQTIYCHIKNLKIFQIYKHHDNIDDIHEQRNDNNEIIYLNKYNNVLKEKFYYNNTNPPFSKPLIKYCIELVDYYKKNINNCVKLVNSCLKKEKGVHNNLLLKCKLEMINFK